jgi:hypothetical protein
MAAIDFLMNGGGATIHGDMPDSFTKSPNTFLSAFGSEVKRLARLTRTPISKLNIFQLNLIYVALDNLNYHFIFADNGGHNEIHYYDRSSVDVVKITELENDVIAELGEIGYKFSIAKEDVSQLNDNSWEETAVSYLNYAKEHEHGKSIVSIDQTLKNDDIPTLFISYSHDNKPHKAWVLQLATRLRLNGIDVILDQWNLTIGKDVAYFMEQGLSNSQRVLCICSENYVTKANKGKGGTGYEKTIITGELLKDVNSNWVIPVIINNEASNKVPLFLNSRMYIDFSLESDYEVKYEELIRELYGEQALPIPPIGPNPFGVIGAHSHKKFIPSNEKYLSPSLEGTVTFDYSNNNGCYTIGQGKLMFETKWSKAGTSSIYAYSDENSIAYVAYPPGLTEIRQIKDASLYDISSHVRQIPFEHIAIFQNTNGYYAAIKVLSIRVSDFHLNKDEIRFAYKIQSNGTSDFTTEGIIDNVI